MILRDSTRRCVPLIDALHWNTSMSRPHWTFQQEYMVDCKNHHLGSDAGTIMYDGWLTLFGWLLLSVPILPTSQRMQAWWKTVH
jgi:hypothetical protein